MMRKQDVNAARLATFGRDDAFLRWIADLAGVETAAGTAVYVGEKRQNGLLAFPIDVLETRHLYRDTVVLAVAASTTAAHVPAAERLRAVRLVGDCVGCRMHSATLEYGFDDDIDVPATLAFAREQGTIAFDPAAAVYVCGEQDVHAGITHAVAMAHWRRRLFATIARHGANLAELLRLPPESTRTRRVAVEL